MASKREKYYASFEKQAEKNVVSSKVGNSPAVKAAFRVAVKVSQIGKFTPLEKKLIVGIENCLNTRYKEFVREFQDWDVQEYVIIQAAIDCPGLDFSFSEKTQTFKINL